MNPHLINGLKYDLRVYDPFGNKLYVFKPLTPPNFTDNDIVINATMQAKAFSDSIGPVNSAKYNRRVLAFYNNVIVGTKDTTITTLPKLLDVILILGRLNGMIDSTGVWRVPIDGIK